MFAHGTQWLTLPARIALAICMALIFGGLAAPSSRAQDQSIAIPACGEVFGIGEVADACLRVINASSPEVGPIDVYVGETPVVEGLEYGQATEYTTILSQMQQIRAVPAGTALDQATVDLNEELQPGGAFQLTVTGLPEQELAGWLSGVDVTPLTTGQARVRAVHASSDLGAINVLTGEGATLFEPIEFGSQSLYVPINAGATSFQVHQSEENTLLLETPEDVQLEEGMNYDIVVIGQSDAGTLEMVLFAAEVGLAAESATPAAVATPIVAVGGTPIAVTPGAETPVATPQQ